jgi:hypothetical protein
MNGAETSDTEQTNKIERLKNEKFFLWKDY